jgi:hypothetical protein
MPCELRTDRKPANGVFGFRSLHSRTPGTLPNSYDLIVEIQIRVAQSAELSCAHSSFSRKPVEGLFWILATGNYFYDFLAGEKECLPF